MNKKKQCSATLLVWWTNSINLPNLQYRRPSKLEYPPRKEIFDFFTKENNHPANQSVYLAIIERGWVGYEEFCRSRRVLSTEAEGRGGRHFDVIGSIIFGGLHFWRHWFNMAKILSKFGEQQLVMVNYECRFNQSETGKYFEWIIINNYSPKWRWIVVDICRTAAAR